MSVSAHPIATIPDHPIRFDVEYPDRRLDRLTTFFRPIVAIPILIVFGLLLGGSYQATTDTGTAVVALVFLWIGAVFVVLYAWLAILIDGRYPRGAFDFIVGVARWQARVAGSAMLLVTDRYPPFNLR